MAMPPFEPGAGIRPVLVEYFRVVYRRRLLAAAVFLAVVTAVAVYTYRAVPIYQAQVSILIDAEEPNVLQFQKVLNEAAASGNSPQTQYELLRSRQLVQETVAAMQLWKRPEFGASSEAAAVSAVREALEIVPIRGTRMAHVRFRWTEPRLAAEIVNAHTRQYVEQTMQKRFLATKEANDFLDRQLRAEQQRVLKAESALQAFREQHDALSLDQGQNIVVQKLADLNAAVTRAKTERIEKETQFRELQAAQSNPASLDSYPAILGNGFVQELKSQVATLQREYAQLSETLGDLHPTMVEKRTALTTAETRLAAEIARVVSAAENAYQAALAAESRLTAALEEQKRESLALSRRGIEYSALQREAESVRLVYQSLLQRAKETDVSGNLRATNVQIIDPAEPSRRPVYPRTTLNMALSLVLGTLLAFGAAFAAEVADDRLMRPGDVTRQLGQPLLALVPELRRRGRRRASLDEPSPDANLVEAFRALRTNLTARLAGPGRRSVLVASAAEREGKTHVAGNLAMALAQAQFRVVLIDADMRRPSLHEQTGVASEHGLAEVLAGTVPLSEALQRLPGKSLVVLNAGRASGRAPELLGSAVFERLIAVLEEHYDWVIIDSPPVLTVTDAALVARCTRGVLLVVGAGVSRGQAAQRAVSDLEQGGGHLIGAVLNRADVSRYPYDFAGYASAGYLQSLPPHAPSDAAAAGSA